MNLPRQWRFTLTSNRVSRRGRSALQGPQGVAGSAGPPGAARAEGGRGSPRASRYSGPGGAEGESLQPVQPAEVLLLLQTGDFTSAAARHRHPLRQVGGRGLLQKTPPLAPRHQTRCFTAVSWFPTFRCFVCLCPQRHSGSG